jgi:hypothetical protein
MGEGIGLTRSGASDYQQRREWSGACRTVFDRKPLFRIEGFEVGGCRLHELKVPQY